MQRTSRFNGFVIVNRDFIVQLQEERRKQYEKEITDRKRRRNAPTLPKAVQTVECRQNVADTDGIVKVPGVDEVGSIDGMESAKMLQDFEPGNGNEGEGSVSDNGLNAMESRESSAESNSDEPLTRTHSCHEKSTEVPDDMREQVEQTIELLNIGGEADSFSMDSIPLLKKVDHHRKRERNPCPVGIQRTKSPLRIIQSSYSIRRLVREALSRLEESVLAYSRKFEMAKTAPVREMIESYLKMHEAAKKTFEAVNEIVEEANSSIHRGRPPSTWTARMREIIHSFTQRRLQFYRNQKAFNRALALYTGSQ